MVCPISSENTCHCSQYCVVRELSISHSVQPQCGSDKRDTKSQCWLAGSHLAPVFLGSQECVCWYCWHQPLKHPADEAMEGELQLFMTVLTLLDSWEVLPVVETKACRCLWSMKCTAFHWIHSSLSLSCFQQVVNQPWTPFLKLQFYF